MSENATFSLSLQRVRNFEFEVNFDWDHLQPLVLDEPEPLGTRTGPNASRLLAAAVANCLSASLLFCLEKSRIEVRDLRTEVKGYLKRNERGRLRVSRIEVRMTLDVPDQESRRIGRCLQIFEDYCVVTASVKKGIEVNVQVTDPAGNRFLGDPSQQL